MLHFIGNLDQLADRLFGGSCQHRSQDHNISLFVQQCSVSTVHCKSSSTHCAFSHFVMLQPKTAIHIFFFIFLLDQHKAVHYYVSL